jgi:hypothetical protein
VSIPVFVQAEKISKKATSKEAATREIFKVFISIEFLRLWGRIPAQQ